ncbi:MAG TPA: tetratricopeptide repeat protein [Noviherbaspirillum sp.]|nr:tetratricopeptide repeat protein [Noviherbaspirillum sp.]
MKKQQKHFHHNRTNSAVSCNAEGDALKQQGRLDGAEACYRQALALKPDFAEAHYNLAWTLHVRGRLDEAKAGYLKALEHDQNIAEAWNNLGLILSGQGQQDDAVDCYKNAITLSPSFAEAYANLGIAFANNGDWIMASECYQKAISLKPDLANAHANLASIFAQQGRLDDAATCYQRVLALTPDDAATQVNLGNVYKGQHKLSDAVTCYLNAIQLKPDLAEAYVNLGTVFEDQGNPDAAIEAYQAALSFKPNLAEAHNNLGLTFAAKGNLSEAIKRYQTALALKPDFADAHNNLGLALVNVGNLSEAVMCYQTALALKPDFADAHNNLGIAFQRQGKPDEAIACHQKAIALAPDDIDAHDCLLLALLYSSKHTPAEVFAAHLQFAQRFEAPLKAAWSLHLNERNPRKRLKIGYVSPDFRNHPVSFFIEPILACHDKSQFEVFCYYNHDQQDAVTQRLQNLADHWISCKGLPDEQLAARIRADGIDILIDLAGHTAGNNLLTFARKPSPVQVAYLGYPFSTGMSAFDYRITDPHAEPLGMTEPWNSEQLWRLPQIFFCYGEPDNSPAPIDHPPARDNGYVTFGCFNNFAKVNDKVIALWSSILNKVPAARLSLVIKGIEDDGLRAEVEKRFERNGVGAGRLILSPPSAENYFAFYNAVDIALDPFPFNGHTTSLDTLWMGVPFITLAGRHYTSRMGVSTLVNAGLPELIANDEQEYQEISVALALDPARLQRIRDGLRERVRGSALIDAHRFTAQLEQAYRNMWQKWCED